ncbi:hypothetical protein [Lichenibacterium ramalinae]|uniref:hypothetical protein n=1 Tax=Lichenibacterium ramalinae TaxID=2316527 RepID=UPI001A92367B|nr:hypothetical protein [Lichenibacterium ramalinae]
MATQTLTALFDRYDDAAAAVRRLEEAGVPHAHISLVSNDAAHSQYYGAVPGDADPMPDAPVSGTGAGASLGTLLGGGAGLLAGLGLLAIPGLGPVVAAGWLAATLVGAGVGAAAGGLVGSLTDIGVSEDDAHAYAEGIQRGGTLLTVKADPAMADRISDILDHDSAVDLAERSGTWRGQGWDGSYAGRGTVTGEAVFTDPTMLAPGAPAGATPAIDAPAAGSRVGNGLAAGLERDGAVVPPDDLGRGPRPVPPRTAAPDATREVRSRVRIYDQP